VSTGWAQEQGRLGNRGVGACEGEGNRVMRLQMEPARERCVGGGLGEEEQEVGGLVGGAHA
jgi:hypothetical protein